MRKILIFIILIGLVLPVGAVAFSLENMGYSVLNTAPLSGMMKSMEPDRGGLSETIAIESGKIQAINTNDYGIPIFIPKSNAGRAVLTAHGTVNMRGYGKGTLRPIVINKDLSILQYEAEGMNRTHRSDNTAHNPFDQMHFQSAGTLKSDCRGDNCLIYATYRDPFGDMVVVELSGSGQQSDWRYLYGTRYFGLPRYKASHFSTIRKWKFLYGTGKFEGIMGTGDALVYTVAASETPGVYPSLKTGPEAIGSSSCCIHLTGIYAIK